MRSILWLSVVALLLTPAAAAARWLEARSVNFIVFSNGDEIALRRAVTTLEDFDALLRFLTNVTAPPSPNPLRIYLVGGKAELDSVESLGVGVQGFYGAHTDGIAAFAIRGGGGEYMGSNEVLLHEYAHHFMLNYTLSAYPAWYVEGFAEYFQTAVFRDKTIEFGRASKARAASLLYGNWLPLETVFTASPRALKQDKMEMFYAQSWLLTHYLLRHPERDRALVAYLGAVNRGDGLADAFRRNFGTDFAGMTAELRTYYRGHGMTLSQLTRSSGAKPVPVLVLPMPSSADTLLLPSAALRLDPSPERGAVLLAIIRQGAAAYPGDPFARRVLARAEIMFGDRAKGAALADALIVEEPAEAEPLYLRGLALLLDAGRDGVRDPAALKKARSLFARANKIDPTNVTILLRYLQAAPDSAAQASQNQLDVAMATHTLAPQIAGASFGTAQLLLRHQRPQEARVILRAIANNPHSGDTAVAAKALLESIPPDAPAPAAAAK